MANAYVETTVLTNVLLKPGTKKQQQAKQALTQYDSTLLPVYSIKEWKRGPLDYFAYFHDKLVQTRSLKDTIKALNEIPPYNPYKKSTAFEALAAAAELESKTPPTKTADYGSKDEEMADRYRLASKTLIMKSWKKRRKITDKTIQDLECYTEAEPRIGEDGFFDLKPKDCDRDRECCLAGELKSAPEQLRKLRDAIPESSTREEDRRRRKVLKQLINTPKLPLGRDQCRSLGDAVFAFFCPVDAIVLTTNIRDHGPLAAAIGKEAKTP